MDAYAVYVHTLATIGDVVGLAGLLENDPTLANHPDEVRFASIPLHWACMYGHLPAAELLLHRGARLDATNTLGMTPLMTASFEGHAHVVKMLLGRGADPMGTVILSNMSALGAAAVAGHVAVIKVFLAFLPLHKRMHTQLGLAFVHACMRGQEAAARTLLPVPDLAHNWPCGSSLQGTLRVMRNRGYNACAQLLKWFHEEVGRWRCLSKVWHLHDQAQTLRHVAHRDRARTRGGTRSARLSAASDVLKRRLLWGQALPAVQVKDEAVLRQEMEDQQAAREGRRLPAYGAKFAPLELLPERKRKRSPVSGDLGRREERRLLAGIVLKHVVENMDTHVFTEFMGYMRPG